MFHLGQEAGASCFNAARPGLAPGDHQVSIVPALCPLSLGVDFAGNTSCPLKSLQVVVLVMKQQSEEIMMRCKLVTRHSCQSRNSKTRYHLDCKELACHVVGLSLLLATKPNLCSNLYPCSKLYLCNKAFYSEVKQEP